MKHFNRWTVAVAAVASLATSGAWAHHSFAMFDRSRTITIDGTIKAVEWNNPHVWVWVTVPDTGSKPGVYALESGGPLQMQRMGASYSKFKVGDRIKVELYPIKDGRLGGQPKVYEFADGSKFNVDTAVVKYASGH